MIWFNTIKGNSPQDITELIVIDDHSAGQKSIYESPKVQIKALRGWSFQSNWTNNLERFAGQYQILITKLNVISDFMKKSQTLFDY